MHNYNINDTEKQKLKAIITAMISMGILPNGITPQTSNDVIDDITDFISNKFRDLTYAALNLISTASLIDVDISNCILQTLFNTPYGFLKICIYALKENQNNNTWIKDENLLNRFSNYIDYLTMSLYQFTMDEILELETQIIINKEIKEVMKLLSDFKSAEILELENQTIINKPTKEVMKFSHDSKSNKYLTLSIEIHKIQLYSCIKKKLYNKIDIPTQGDLSAYITKFFGDTHLTKNQELLEIVFDHIESNNINNKYDLLSRLMYLQYKEQVTAVLKFNLSENDVRSSLLSSSDETVRKSALLYIEKAHTDFNISHKYFGIIINSIIGSVHERKIYENYNSVTEIFKFALKPEKTKKDLEDSIKFINDIQPIDPDEIRLITSTALRKADSLPKNLQLDIKDKILDAAMHAILKTKQENMSLCICM